MLTQHVTNFANTTESGSATDERNELNPNMFARIVKDMNKLHDEHYVWQYINPTFLYVIYETDYCDELNAQEDTHMQHFINWYDDEIMVIQQTKTTQWQYLIGCN
jgi:hypothetical protein